MPQTLNLSIFQTHSYGNTGGIKFEVSDEVAIDFNKRFKRTFTIGNLSETAFSNFNSSYSVTESRAKFLMLMTCLESIFNTKGIEITHTISRHLSIVLSNTREEFNINYEKVKKLYSFKK